MATPSDPTFRPDGRRPRRPGPARRLTRVEETSAGGLVVDRGRVRPCAALIARHDRRGRLVWSLPKGHVEDGETATDAAVREIREETGIAAGVELVDLGRTRDFRGLISGAHFRSRSLGALLPEGTTAAGVRLSDEHDAVELLTFAEARARLRFPENVSELLAWEGLLPVRR